MRLFKKKAKPIFLADIHGIIEAFKMDGKTYYQYEDTVHTPAGRAMQALIFYEEFNQRCTREYLQAHTKAMRILLSDPKAINIMEISRLNINLEERLNLALLPDHIYKLASVVFFDETESPYTYSQKYNEKKIEEWKRHGGTLDFFQQTQLKDLIPVLKSPALLVETFSEMAEKIDKLHQEDLQAIVSSKE